MHKPDPRAAAAPSLSRRTLVTGAAAAAAAATLAAPLGRLRAQGTPHTFRVGAFEVTVVTDGTLTLPLSLAFPDRDRAEVSQVLSGAGLPGDAIYSQVNVALVRTPEALILVDTGGGPDFMPTIGKLADNIEASGIAADKITHVVFTHAHADHLWGVIDPLDGGSRFVNARHVMSATERDYWLKPGRENEVPDAFKTMAIGTHRRLTTLAERIDTGKAGEDVIPGVTLVETAGHTPGHLSVLLRSGGEQLLIGGDALAHPLISFAHPNWRVGTDMEPDRAIATRKRLLAMLTSEKIPLLGYHLPWPGLGRVEAHGSAHRFVLGG